jgi:hypothetical protein
LTGKIPRATAFRRLGLLKRLAKAAGATLASVRNVVNKMRV